MIEITDYAYKILFTTLSNNLHKFSEYGTPPIFYWYRRMIEETRNIESCQYLSRGELMIVLLIKQVTVEKCIIGEIMVKMNSMH